MRQVAVFADAGYVYAAGAIILTGSNYPRTIIDLNTSEMIAKLESTAKNQANGAQLLRIYWYDGLLGRQLSPEQERMAHSNNVKIRLGTVTAGQQKGVDSLIVTDLIELARNHAISDAVLLSGDEDIRIGVQIAQSFGIRVHLVGIESSNGNQSHLLQQEADTTVEWSREVLEKIISIKSVAIASSTALQNQERIADDQAIIRENFNQVVAEIVDLLNKNELLVAAEELAQNPQNVPYEYDRILLARGRGIITRDLDPSERRYLRDKFKEIVASRRF